MMNDTVSLLVGIASILFLLMLLGVLSQIMGEIVPSIKKTIYKICWGEPIKPYRIGKMPEGWRYNARLFDGAKLFK